MNVYGPLFDNVFLDSKQYETKWTECSSTSIKTYNATSSSSPSNKLDRHKVDFALRDINKEYDVIVGEDKPPHTSNKDVQETIIKNKRVRMVALDILQKNLPIKLLITQFEELTSFWHGAPLKICGTRRINGTSIHYEAARACLSRTPGDFKGGSQFVYMNN
ncbi:hypothetical protein BDC45DRAFT_254995 [Circinella umbellata]|nr:hypothetical protein BDC45DRAFT_254995 [Circinella umbellata]